MSALMTRSYGRYLTFEGVINIKTSYVNATRLYNNHDKHLKNWTPTQTTQQQFQAFESEQNLLTNQNKDG